MKTLLTQFWQRRWCRFFGAGVFVFGLLMLHPYPRQSLFGPTIRGRPWCVWDTGVRWKYVMRPKSWLDPVYDWIDTHRTNVAHESFDDAEMVPLIVALLDDADPKVRLGCVNEILYCPKLRDRSALPALGKMLNNDDAEVVLDAAWAIWLIDLDEKVLDRV